MHEGWKRNNMLEGRGMMAEGASDGKETGLSDL
jgi:hypothetical protein